MTAFIIRRVLTMVVSFFLISIVVFITIQLPPGDYASNLIALAAGTDARVINAQAAEELAQNIRARFGLDRPQWQQYLFWIGNFMRGDFGLSLETFLPVREMLEDRLLISFGLSLVTLLFTWAIGIPIGIYTATHKNTLGDHAATLAGFIGLSIPNFFLALVLMVFALFALDLPVGRLLSAEYEDEAWSLAKLWDLAKNLWIPIIVIGTAGHGQHHPHHARQPSGGTGAAARDHRPLQGHGRAGGHQAAQRPHRVQPVHQRPRPVAAGHAVGRDDHLDRAESAHRRTAAVQGSPAGGRVPGRKHSAVLRDLPAAGQISSPTSHWHGSTRGFAMTDRGLVMSSDQRPTSPRPDPSVAAAAHAVGLEETAHFLETERRTPRQLAWRRFRKNRLAVASAVVVALFYLMALFAEFLSPYHHDEKFTKLRFAPPQRVHFFDEEGRLSRPFTYALKQELDLETFALTYQEQKDAKYYVRFFVRGEPYRWLGLFPMQRHLFAVEEGGSIFLFGTDTLGRDLLSRILIGSQVSLSVPLVGTLVTIIIGTILGIASGYFGRMIDHALQRFIEVLISFPRVPLWLAFSAAIPATWPSGWVYMGIVVAISLIGWGGLARVVRGKVLAYRNEEYVLAAEGVGAGTWRIITKHPAAGLAESHHRRGDAVGARADPGGEQSELPGRRRHTAHDELGNPAAGGAERAGAAAPALARPAGDLHHRHRARVQFSRRRRP